MMERVLKLSLPTLYFWLAMFYVLFHLWLNVLAEMTTFADREFYKARRAALRCAVPRCAVPRCAMQRMAF